MEIKDVITCLQIVMRVKPGDKYPLAARSDVLYLGLSEEDVPVGSPVGRELSALGAGIGECGWEIYV